MEPRIDHYPTHERHGFRLRRGHRDGSGDNASWNWGCEGESTDREIQALRRQVMKNTFCLLLLSNGVPMILVGDEMGRTQHGNNNTYCHDSDLTWMDWTLVQQNAELLRFVKKLLMFRKAHAALRARAFLRHADYRGLERPISAFTVQGPFARHLQG